MAHRTSGSRVSSRSSEAKSTRRTQRTQHAQERSASGQRLLPAFMCSVRTQWIVLVCVALVLYAPTLRYEFVLDDTYVIVNNTFVQRGVAGIGGILTADALSGDTLAVTEAVLSGGRYRPLSLVMFACEVELTRALTASSAQSVLSSSGQAEQQLSPVLFHATSVALNAVVVVLLFFTLRLWLASNTREDGQTSGASAERSVAEALPFIAALLFAVHPIHTEVVANVKSRDEILCLLGSLGALYFYLRYLSVAVTHSVRRLRLLGVSALLYGCALFAKETALTMVAVFPIAAYTSAIRHRSRSAEGEKETKLWWELWLPALIFLLMAGVFLCVRGLVVGFSLGEPSNDILVNPFAHATYSERLATAVAILLRYLASSIFPVVMSYEYGYNQIPIVGWLHWQTLLSVVIHGVLIGYALWSLKSRGALQRGAVQSSTETGDDNALSGSSVQVLSLPQRVTGLSLWMYGASISIVSNIVVNIGAPMGDRFLYMPTVGSVLLLGYGAIVSAQQLRSLLPHVRLEALVLCVVCLVAGAYTVRTLMRLPAWQSQYSLRVSDVDVVPMSMRARGGAATVQMLRASELPLSAEREQLLTSAYQHLQAAIAIDPSAASEMYNNLGAYFESYRSNYDSAAYYYEQASRFAPRNAFYAVNALGARGLAAAMRKNWDSAIVYFQQAIALSTNPSAAATTSQAALHSAAVNNTANLGVVYFTQRRFAEAAEYFTRAAQLNPAYPRIQEMLNAARQQAAQTTADSVSSSP